LKQNKLDQKFGVLYLTSYNGADENKAGRLHNGEDLPALTR